MTQPTLKHDEWAKIVELRHQQKNVLAEPNRHAKTIGLALLFITLSCCVWYALSNTYNTPKSTLERDAQNRVTRYFSKQFIMGTWHLEEVAFTHQKIITYVKIPKAIAMNDFNLAQYIRQSLCPPANSNIWRDIQSHKLSINLYVNNPKKGKQTQCDNPNTRLTGRI